MRIYLVAVLKVILPLSTSKGNCLQNSAEGIAHDVSFTYTFKSYLCFWTLFPKESKRKFWLCFLRSDFQGLKVSVCIQRIALLAVLWQGCVLCTANQPYEFNDISVTGYHQRVCHLY